MAVDYIVQTRPLTVDDLPVEDETPQDEEEAALEVYDVVCCYEAAPGDGVTLMRAPFVREVQFPLNLGGSRAICAVAATASATFNIKKNGSTFASFSFVPGTLEATFGVSDPTTFTSADILSITAPSPNDLTLAKLGITIKGVRVV